MKLVRKKIGDFVEQYNEKCNIPNLTIYNVSGVNREKEFFEPSQQVGNDTSNYKIVPVGYFACNLMHVGRDVVLPISLNMTDKRKIVSPAYFVFSINHEEIILKEFFFMYINSIEKDRFFWFHTDSSVRDGLSWEDFCNLEIQIPPIEIQQKYVDIYNSLLENQKAFEKGTDDLKLVCDAYIEKLRRENKTECIGSYIEEVNNRNINLQCLNIQGVENTHNFIETRANTTNLDFSNYKVVNNNCFAYNPARLNIGSIALCEEICIISPMYTVFKIANLEKLLPKYLMLWFTREEFKHYTTYFSFGSVRDIFEYKLMEEVKIPIPSIEIQQDIVNIYEVYNKRKMIAEKLKEQIKNICPVLIAGAIKEGEKANG